MPFDYGGRIAIYKMYKNTKAVAQIYGFCYYYRSISNSIFWAISSDVGNSFL